MLLRGAGAGPGGLLVLSVGGGGGGTRALGAAAGAVLQALRGLAHLREGASFALARLIGPRPGERASVLLQPVRSPVLARRCGQLLFGLHGQTEPTTPADVQRAHILLHVRELPLGRALAGDLRLLVAGRAGSVVLQVPGQVVEVCGGLAGLRGAGEAIGSAQFRAGAGQGGARLLTAVLGFLFGPVQALKSLGAAEPMVGQVWKLKLEPLATVGTQVWRRTYTAQRERKNVLLFMEVPECPLK